MNSFDKDYHHHCPQIAAYCEVIKLLKCPLDRIERSRTKDTTRQSRRSLSQFSMAICTYFGHNLCTSRYYNAVFMDEIFILHLFLSATFGTTLFTVVLSFGYKHKLALNARALQIQNKCLIEVMLAIIVFINESVSPSKCNKPRNYHINISYTFHIYHIRLSFPLQCVLE